ncbi:MAG: DUF5053 domain-containing protein [Prevotellaceae bacterium]|nr:DUF5053 domain-containing protein [Prevotellaceae bacterium]
MKQKIEELKKRYRVAKTNAELDAVRKEIAELAATDRKEFEKAALSSIKETNDILQEDRLRKRIEDILPAISVSYLAKNYFGKTPQWFYQRLNGNLVNGTEAKFTEDELKTLSSAFLDLSDKIKQSVSFIV